MIKEIKFTDNAIKQINHLLSKKEKGSFFRIAIKGGGCSGFMKELDYCEADDITDKDMVEEHGDVKVVVDMKSMLFLADAVIDYKDGLMDAGFTINIPSAKNSCGCGTSFSV